MLPTPTPRWRLTAATALSVLATLVAVGPATARGATPTPPSPTASPTPLPPTTPVPTPVPTPVTTPVPPGGVEDFARYDPETRCTKRVKRGTSVLGAWLVATWGGRGGATWRACSRSTSEHQDGRAIDWSLDARNPADAQRAATLLQTVLAPDAAGNPAALARRMGIMYLIWDDRIYSAWNRFVPRPYVSSGCSRARLNRCSATLRHRDHVHVSLSRAGAAGRTSWYVGRLPAR